MLSIKTKSFIQFKKLRQTGHTHGSHALNLSSWHYRCTFLWATCCSNKSLTTFNRSCYLHCLLLCLQDSGMTCLLWKWCLKRHNYFFGGTNLVISKENHFYIWLVSYNIYYFTWKQRLHTSISLSREMVSEMIGPYFLFCSIEIRVSASSSNLANKGFFIQNFIVHHKLTQWLAAECLNSFHWQIQCFEAIWKFYLQCYNLHLVNIHKDNICNHCSKNTCMKMQVFIWLRTGCDKKISVNLLGAISHV